MIRSIQVKHAVLASGCAALVATAVGFLVAEAQVQPAGATALATMPGSDAIADVAERVVGSVVNVSSSQTIDDGPAAFDPFFSDPRSPGFGTPFGFGDGDAREAKSMGSGVIVSASGRVLTNAHVIRGADTITVTLHDGTDHKAKVVGVDPRSDVAVLQLDGPLPRLEPLPFADSSKLRIGEMVLAVGNPFGVGQAVTMGIVSATGRASVGIAAYEDFIQTDAAINPGNSGGALVNMKGELVGINTAILSRTGGYQGIGFAIPSAMARSIMDMLVKDGKVSRGYLGVNPVVLDEDAAARLKLPVRSGVLLAGVGDDTPAAKAGLTQGTVVTAIDGQPVNDPGRLRNLIATTGAGKQVSLAVIQDGKPRTVKVKLTELPDADQLKVGRRATSPRGQQPSGQQLPGRQLPGGGTMRGESIIIHPDGTIERRQLP